MQRLPNLQAIPTTAVGVHRTGSTSELCDTEGSTRSLVGGGSLSKSFAGSELNDIDKSLRLPGTVVYELVAVVPSVEKEALVTRYPHCLFMDIRPALLAPKLTVPELKDLCRYHHITYTSYNLRPKLIDMLATHVCDERCNQATAILKIAERRVTRADPPDPTVLGNLSKTFVIDGWTEQSGKGCLGQNAGNAYTVVGFTRSGSTAVPEGCITMKASIRNLLPVLTRLGLFALGNAHNLGFAARWTKQQCMDYLEVHDCNDECNDVETVLKTTDKASFKGVHSKGEGQCESKPFVWVEPPSLHTGAFPPPPLSKAREVEILADYCDDLDPKNFEEKGCAVCGQLTLLTELTPLDKVSFSLDPLLEPGVTVKESKHWQATKDEIPGPVIDKGLDSVCNNCSAELAKGRRPKMALANGLWLGEVPDVLKGLTFLEQAVIARVRHHRFMVRVSAGHYKMKANIIAFANPIVKIYQKLPPSPEELDEMLAVIFTGASPPTEEELSRTPVMVRANKVRAALHWLLVNHSDYRDVLIDEAALKAYEGGQAPVEVVHVKVKTNDGNKIANATSQFDNEMEEGTSSGPCPYVVNGLTHETFSKMDTLERKAAVLNHLKMGGKALAIGHAENPESIFDNYRLYPSMFPWLFPYGFGAIGQPRHFNVIAEETHRKWLLMYHDKRFQRDPSFIIGAFNHLQIKSSTHGSFMMVKRGKFESIARKLAQLNPVAIKNIADRLAAGGARSPKTEAEKEVFRVMDEIEYVGGHVEGSLAKRKFLRNEVWSLISFQGAPSWFITVSPLDNRHPLCIYWAGEEVYFRPEVKSSTVRNLLTSGNPVACARFFDRIVKLIIKHLFGWDTDKAGLWGKVTAYYGTVEQQGRMTLHWHVILWILNCFSPSEIRKRLLDPDSGFRKEMIAYLESGCSGDFHTGSRQEVSERIPRSKPKERGIHTIIDPEHEVKEDIGYRNPTLNLPEGPPGKYCEGNSKCGCTKCEMIDIWYENYLKTVDDILLRCNVHTCYGMKSSQGKGGKGTDKLLPKEHPTGKGCVDKNGVCTSRFPRELSTETVVDEKDGHITMKKNEPWLNDFTRGFVWTSRCNTDTSSLQSGTGIKATVGYVCDYLTKPALKSYQVFSTMYDVWKENCNLLSDPVEDEKKDVKEEDKPHKRRVGDGARKMILKVVNALGAKMEIGSPMAAMYLMGNPDHYTSHSFVNFYWKNYYNFVNNAWINFERVLEPNPEVQSKDGVSDGLLLKDEKGGYVHENVAVGRNGDRYVTRSNVDNYRFRPEAHEAVSLYEWTQCNVRRKISDKSSPLSFYRYLEEHALCDSHEVACDLERRTYMVPNFLGPPFPRKDQADEEEYYRAIMVVFKPWRTGIDLKASDETWKQAFERTEFCKRFTDIFDFLHVRYECYDARDDFFSQRKALGLAPTDGGAEIDEYGDDGLPWGQDYEDVDAFDMDIDDEEVVEVYATAGSRYKSALERADQFDDALVEAGWKIQGISALKAQATGLPDVPVLDSSTWDALVKAEKARLWKERLQGFHGPALKDRESKSGMGIADTVRVVDASYFFKNFIPPSIHWGKAVNDLVTKFMLNEDQERAFRIVANHAACVAPKQLLMYLAGMAGSGKTRVILCLLEYFKLRGEPYRIVLLGPTGSSAALINGSTYHSFLGIYPGMFRRGKGALASLEEVRERMYGVSYVLLDEISMVSCEDLARISGRLGDIFNEHEKPFGGINFIASGDFAQLPPVKGATLYSASVSTLNHARQSQLDQERAIGKRIWGQFVTVVLLKRNMRQTVESPADAKFRTALTNLRFRACTQEDVKFLKSLVATRNPAISLEDKVYKDVSIITALNVDKDFLNVKNTNRFALENGVKVYSFYCIDTLASQDVIQTAWTMAKGGPTRRLTPGLRKLLWNQQPSTSEQVAACLKLCIGMPVMIRHNVATELCITRGQEGVVAGWNASPIPGFPGYDKLDVLFVKLEKAPRHVQLPGLPPNVVPLPPRPQSVEALYPNGTSVRVRRRQVPVLPNFSMTDYASQGKTREVNVIDLQNAQSHQAIYTALSRGTDVARTIVVRDFDVDKLMGPMAAGLKQEFRDLEILNEISVMRYNNTISEDVIRETREQTLTVFKRDYRVAYSRLKLHPKLELEEGEVSGEEHSEESDVEEGSHSAGRGDLTDKPNILGKRKIRDAVFTVHKRARAMGIRHAGRECPPGPIWDSVDHSCAYDAVTFVLFNTWKENMMGHTEDMFLSSPAMAVMVENFVSWPEERLENIRNEWRAVVHTYNERLFPTGARGADLYALLPVLCLGKLEPERSTWLCGQCGQHYQSNRTDHVDGYMLISDGEPNALQAFVHRAETESRWCQMCGRNTVARVNRWKTLLCFQLTRPSETTVPAIETERGTSYRLVGAIYWGDHHFIARVVDESGCIWVHDGITTRDESIYEDSMANRGGDRRWWSECGGKRLVCVWYGVCNQTDGR